MAQMVVDQLLEQMDQYMDIKTVEKNKNDQAELAHFLREKESKLRPLMRPDIKVPVAKVPVPKKKVTWE
jgi:hypothetical protein